MNLDCLICREILKQPVILPCGCSVCQKHENEKKSTNEKIKCPKCLTEYDIPENGFIKNSIVASLIEQKLDKLDRAAEHKIAFESLNDLKQLVEELKRFEDNPELERHRLIDDLKSKIEFRRDEDKKRIDDEATVLIEQLDEYKKTHKTTRDQQNRESFALSKEANDLMKSLESDLIEWENDLKKFNRNMEKWKMIHEETVTKYENLYKEKKRIRPSLFTDDILELQFMQKKFCKEGIVPIM